MRKAIGGYYDQFRCGGGGDGTEEIQEALSDKIGRRKKEAFRQMECRCAACT